jgi:ABC-type glycerol-3-phosphate transport system permease component
MMTTFKRAIKNWDWAIPKTPVDGLIWLALVGMFLFYLMPVYVMVINGLKEAQEVSLSTMWNLPTEFSGGGFVAAWTRHPPWSTAC